MIIRLIRFCRWIGHNGISAVIAEQLGTAMMPLCSAMRRPLISGIANGTLGSMRIRGGIVDHDGARLHGDRRELARDAAAGGKQRDIDAIERIFAKFFDHDGFTTKADRFAGGPCAGQRLEPADRKSALVQGGNEFPTYSAGHAGNGNYRVSAHVRLHFV